MPDGNSDLRHLYDAFFNPERTSPVFGLKPIKDLDELNNNQRHILFLPEPAKNNAGSLFREVRAVKSRMNGRSVEITEGRRSSGIYQFAEIAQSQFHYASQINPDDPFEITKEMVDQGRVYKVHQESLP